MCRAPNSAAISDERQECRHVGRRCQPCAACIEDLEPCFAQASERLAPQRRIVHQRSEITPGKPFNSRAPTNRKPAAAATRTICGGVSSGTV
jgi:hypothetical protein